MIENKYLLIRDWDLSKIPKLSLGQYNNPGELVIKYNFIINILELYTVIRKDLAYSEIVD